MLPLNFLSRPAKVFSPKGHIFRRESTLQTTYDDRPVIGRSILSDDDIQIYSIPDQNSGLEPIESAGQEPMQESSGFALQPTSTNEPLFTSKKEEYYIDNQTLTHVKTVDRGETDNDSGELIFEDESGRSYPDGGSEAWFVVFGSFMGLIPVFGIINSLGAIESYIAKNQLENVPLSIVSWVFSLFLVISFLGCLLTGGYFDRNGAKIPMCAGTIMYTAGLIALADCQEVYQFVLAFSVLCGLGTGILMTPLVSVIATWFFRKRGIATSVATMGGSVGGIAISPVLRKLYVEVGFEWAIRIFALICLFCLTISIFIVKEKERPVAIPFTSRWEELKWYFNSSFNWRYFLEAQFLFVALGAALSESALTALSTYVASYSLAVGNSESISYNLITATNAAGILGRYIPGYLADRYLGGFNVVIITVTMAVFFNLVIWLPYGTHIEALWVYVTLYGFSTGSIMSLTPVCVGQISRTDDFGKRYSTVYFLEALLTIPVLPISGAIINDGSVANYNKFIIFNSIVMLAGAISYLISRSITVGFKWVKY